MYSSEHLAKRGRDQRVRSKAIGKDQLCIAGLAASEGRRNTASIEAKESASARHRQTVVADVANVRDGCALIRPVGTRVDVYPELLVGGVDVELRDASVSESRRPREVVNDDELIRGG